MLYIEYLTIIPRARVGYEVIDSQRGAKKNHQQILLYFAYFAWLEKPEGNLMDAISRVWYKSSYTITAKPIKTLELHYTMVQVLIITIIIHSKYFPVSDWLKPHA